MSSPRQHRWDLASLSLDSRPDVIRRIEAAAPLRDKTVSLVREEAAREWLARHQNGKK
ncbi:hypothetical protein ACVIGA_004673 [Bradyrhizobium sp. USDA 3240]